MCPPAKNPILEMGHNLESHCQENPAIWFQKRSLTLKIKQLKKHKIRD